MVGSMLHECGRPGSTCGLLGGTCGGGGGATSSSSSFSISNLFPSYTPTTPSYNSTGSSSGGAGEGWSSYVDCTLSLGTPSTRHAGAAGPGPGFGGPGPAQPPSSLPWDVMGRPNKQQCFGGGGGGGGGFLKGNGGDALRRCANCDTTSTPLWRNGPRGPKSLCNACGIRYKKEERRAATSSAVPPPPPSPQQQWGCYGAAVAASKGAVSIAMYGDDGADSWRLNAAAAAAAAQGPQFHVRDWPSLFQYN